MRTFVLAAEVVGTTLLMLALAAPPACGQTLGEVSAATGLHGTLSRQSLGSSQGALGSVKSSLAKSSKPKDLGFGSSSGAKLGSRPSSRSKPTASGSSGSRNCGSWVTAASAGKGSASSAWLQGGGGWATGGGGRAPANRRPRS